MNEDKESSTTPERPDKKTLREFSKSVNPNTRAFKTPEIIQERSFRRGAINSLGEQIKWEEDHLKLWQPKAENIEAEVQKTDTDIARIKTNLVLRIFQRGKLDKLERKKQETESSEDYKSITYYHHTLERLDQLRQTLDIEKQHNKTKELLRAFYKDQEEDWKRYQEDLHASSLENIIAEYGVVFVHGITDKIHLKHGFITKPLSWEDKLYINLTIGPTLSASAIKKGYTIDNMFARCGIILNRGRVMEASPYDLGSVSESFTSKHRNDSKKHGDMTNEIKYVIDNSDKKIAEIHDERYKTEFQVNGTSYTVNEFIVNNPQICGLYFCPDNSGMSPSSRFISEDDYPEFTRIEAVIKEIKIPFYVIKNGVVFEAQIDNGEIKVLNPVKPEELTQRKYELPEQVRNEQLSRLMENCPFKLKIPEVWLVQSMAQGKMTYIELNSPGETDEKAISEQKPISFPGAFEIISFSRDKNGRLICTKIRAVDQRENEYNFHFDFWSLENGIINLGFTNEQSQVVINNNETYLRAMEEIITKAKERLKGVPPQSYQVKEKHIERIAFHLYGYGEQAEINGEHEIKQKAFELASQILPYEEYLRIIRQRVGPNGEFRMIPEDLKK